MAPRTCRHGFRRHRSVRRDTRDFTVDRREPSEARGPCLPWSLVSLLTRFLGRNRIRSLAVFTRRFGRSGSPLVELRAPIESERETSTAVRFRRRPLWAAAHLPRRKDHEGSSCSTRRRDGPDRGPRPGLQHPHGGNGRVLEPDRLAGLGSARGPRRPRRYRRALVHNGPLRGSRPRRLARL